SSRLQPAWKQLNEIIRCDYRTSSTLGAVKSVKHMDAQVLIVGAGPTGLTLAIDLGRRGVRALVVEQKDAPQFLPKMERCNARTVAISRRMGIVEKVRAAGLPAHCPMDIFIVLSLVEPALVHHVHPSVAEAKAQIAKSEDGNQPLEPYQLI